MKPQGNVFFDPCAFDFVVVVVVRVSVVCFLFLLDYFCFIMSKNTVFSFSVLLCWVCFFGVLFYFVFLLSFPPVYFTSFLKLGKSLCLSALLLISFLLFLYLFLLKPML